MATNKEVENDVILLVSEKKITNIVTMINTVIDKDKYKNVLRRLVKEGSITIDNHGTISISGIGDD